METYRHHDPRKRHMRGIVADKTSADQIRQYFHGFCQHIIKRSLSDLTGQRIHNIKKERARYTVCKQTECIEEHHLISVPAVHILKCRNHDPHEQKRHRIIKRLRYTIDQKRITVTQHSLNIFFGKKNRQPQIPV